MEKDKRFREENNFRDLGGLKTKNHTYVVYHTFYRSAGPYKMNHQEREALNSLHLCSILDMRTKEESAKDPDPEIAGAVILRHSGVVSRGGEDIDFSPAGMNKIGDDAQEQLAKLTQYYIDMPFHNNAIQVMLDEVRKGHVPILIHCATGKDRTGVAVMVLLMALGCDRDTVLEDYLLSNVYRRERLDQVFARDREKIEAHPEYGELLQMKEGVSEKIGRAVLDEIFRRYPDEETFLEKEYSLGEKELRDLRERYTYA